jgi:hypothetical protein
MNLQGGEREMITKEQYDDIMAREIVIRNFLQTNKLTAAESATLPTVTNEERSSCEVYDFVTNPPDKYVLYINDERHEATTWTGEKLGHVTGLSQTPKRSNFGDLRIYIDVYGINGKKYHGVYYKSAGDYARIKMYKNQDK